MPSSNTHTFKSTQKMQKYKNQKSMDMKRKLIILQKQLMNYKMKLRLKIIKKKNRKI